MKKIIAVVLFAGCISSANAGLMVYGSEGEFSAAGAVTYSINFNTKPENTGDLSFFANGGVRHYINVGMYFEIGDRRIFLTSDDSEPVHVSVAGNYDMLAVNAADYGRYAPTWFTITTSLGNEYTVEKWLDYKYMSFIGFRTTDNETITSLSFDSMGASGVNEIKLGTAAEDSSADIPEPNSIFLIFASGAGIILSRRRKIR